MWKKSQGGNSYKIVRQKRRRINRDEEMDLLPEWFAITKKLLHRRLEWSYRRESGTIQQEPSSLLMTVEDHIVVPGATDHGD